MKKIKKRSPVHGDNLSRALTTPCTIKECVELAKAVAGDAISEFSRVTTPHEVQQTIYIETLLDLLKLKGIITDKEFKESLTGHVTEYNEKREEYLKSITADDSDDSKSE